jgi:hypothetical protein
MANRNGKIKWRRVGTSFDLERMNEGSIDKDCFRRLLSGVETASANWRKGMHFNQRAYKAFEDWIEGRSDKLPGFAYALLSNWFLTSLKFIRESPRGQAALRFWKVLFCEIPQKRLTDPKRNDKILHERFQFWWDKQQECQRIDE